MVKHYKENEIVLCKTKAKKIVFTTNKDEVTCKKCLRIISPLEPKPKKDTRVVHFQGTDNKIECGKDKKGLKTTDLKTEITCKKCLKKLFPSKTKEETKPKVLHYQEVDGKVICETTKENVETTDLKTEVTCKKCLRKIKALSRKKINKIKFIEDRKWGFCLKIRTVFLKLGDNLDSKIGTMILVNDAGMLSTSMKMYGNVLDLLSIKEANYLRSWFLNFSMGNGGTVLVSDVKEAFQENINIEE